MPLTFRSVYQNQPLSKLKGQSDFKVSHTPPVCWEGMVRQLACSLCPGASPGGGLRLQPAPLGWACSGGSRRSDPTAWARFACYVTHSLLSGDSKSSLLCLSSLIVRQLLIQHLLCARHGAGPCRRRCVRDTRIGEKEREQDTQLWAHLYLLMGCGAEKVTGGDWETTVGF